MKHEPSIKPKRARSILVVYATLGLIILFTSSCVTRQENIVRQDFNARANSYFGLSQKKAESVKGDPAGLDGSLESYISYSLQNSPELEASFERWRASINRIAKNRRLPEPVISYGFFIRNIETRVGPQRHRIGLKQSFPWPTKLTAGADAASAKAQALGRKFDARVIAIQTAVAQIYWSLWYYDETRKEHKEHLEILRGLSESAGALVMTGKTNFADQQQIDLTVARIEDLLSAIDEQKIRAAANLRGLIGAPPSLPVLVKSSPPAEVLPADEEKLLESVRNHPLLGSFEALAKSSEAEARRENASRFPSFNLGLDWIETGPASIAGLSDSGKDAVIIGLAVQIPLWQGSYTDAVEAFQSETRAHRADGQAAHDKAVAKFYNILSDLRDALRRIDLYRSTLVPQAESVFESVLGVYTSGSGNVASILLAQRDLLELRAQLIGARADFARAWARLENTVGHSIESAKEEPKRSGDKQ
jgi:outer membrane protein, heavy metal efflux system